MTFPSPPWNLRGDLWVSAFPVRSTGRADRPGGLYGVALVDYRSGGVLTYRELLVARLRGRGPRPEVTITDIWVDSEVSLAGGRALWAIPKDLAALDLGVAAPTGPLGVRRATAAMTVEGAPTASLSVGTATRAAPPAPFAFTTVQRRDDGSVVRARVSGSARLQPGRARWEFDPAGPLGWLAGRRALTSACLADFRMTFGDR